MARLVISRELAKNSLLTAGLNGVKAVLQRETGLESIAITTADKVKADMKNKGNMTFPYAWMEPSDGQSVRDQINTRAVQRTGVRVGTYGATRNTSRVGFIYPVRLGMELKYTDNDALRLYRMFETFLILSSINKLNFDMVFAKQFVLNTRVEIPESTTIPIADTGDTTKPGGSEISISMIIHTYAGFFRDISSVYASDPIIGTVIRKNEDDTSSELSDDEIHDYEPNIPQEFTSNDPRPQ